MEIDHTFQNIVGEQIVTDGCRTIEFRGKKICCAWKLEVVIKNCGDFLVYRLGPTGFCPSAYCVEGKKFSFVHNDRKSVSFNAIWFEPLMTVPIV